MILAVEDAQIESEHEEDENIKGRPDKYFVTKQRSQILPATISFRLLFRLAI